MSAWLHFLLVFLSKQGNQLTLIVLLSKEVVGEQGVGGGAGRGAPATFHSNTQLVFLLTIEDFSRWLGHLQAFELLKVAT